MDGTFFSRGGCFQKPCRLRNSCAFWHRRRCCRSDHWLLANAQNAEWRLLRCHWRRDAIAATLARPGLHCRLHSGRVCGRPSCRTGEPEKSSLNLAYINTTFTHDPISHDEPEPWWFLAWLANPVAVFGWALRNFTGPRLARWPAGAACLFGCATWGLMLMGSVNRLLVGYYLLHLSLVTFSVAALLLSARQTDGIQ
jgi:hypothetical protein